MIPLARLPRSIPSSTSTLCRARGLDPLALARRLRLAAALAGCSSGRRRSTSGADSSTSPTRMVGARAAGRARHRQRSRRHRAAGRRRRRPRRPGRSAGRRTRGRSSGRTHSSGCRRTTRRRCAAALATSADLRRGRPGLRHGDEGDRLRRRAASSCDARAHAGSRQAGRRDRRHHARAAPQVIAAGAAPVAVISDLLRRRSRAIESGTTCGSLA